MHHHCENVKGCKFCKFLSRTFGRLLMFALLKRWPKIEQKEVIRHLRGLDLEIVGGLRDRGWTIHDIDVVGKMKDVPILIERVRKATISNPVHFCDDGFKQHSHLMTIKDGLEVLFLGDKMYKKG